MYESAYNKLFWGMLFIVFNINLGVINIMPNFIGYMLILSGLGTLSNQHSIFEKGRTPAAILIIITLKDIVNFGEPNLLYSQFPMDSLWLTALGVVETLLKIYLIYIICKGVYLLAEERDMPDLSDSARGRFKAYFVMEVILLFLMPFAMNLPRNISGFMLFPILICLMAELYIAGLFRKSRIKLGEGGGDLNV